MSLSPADIAIRRLMLATAVVLCVIDAQAQSLWELTPYRVKIVVAFSQQAHLSRDRQQDLLTSLHRRIDRSLGAAWDADITAASGPLRWAILRGAIDDEILAQAIQDDEADKLLMVSITQAPVGIGYAAREVDLRTRFTGAMVRARVTQPERAAEQLFALVTRTFAPLTRIESVDGREAVLRQRAVSLAVAEPKYITLAVGDILRPAIRFNDREGRARGIRPIEFTFLRVESVEGSAVRAQIHTGLRSPLSGRRRGRVEPLALSVRQPSGTTELSLQAAGDKAEPLVGYDIFAYAPPSRETTRIGQSDRRGTIRIAAREEPLQVLLVRHGTTIVGRLPVVPGLEETLRVRLADDDLRLQAEGRLQGIQQQLVDAIAQREILLRRTEMLLADGEIDRARSTFEELRRLRGQREFTRELDQAERELVVADPRMQQKIDRMIDDTRGVVNEFMRPASIEAMQRTLRAAGDSAAAAASPAEEGPVR